MSVAWSIRRCSLGLIRLNLRNVPEADRPPQETPDPDYDPKVQWTPNAT
jgi:hypothetical protein